MVVSNDQTTYTTDVPVAAPTSLPAQASGAGGPISIPVTISNDQTTFTTDVPITNPPSLPTSVYGGNNPVPSIGNTVPGETATVPATEPQPAASTGGAIPIVPVPKPVLSTALTISNDQPPAQTGQVPINSGAASGSVPSLVILPSTRPSLEGPNSPAGASITGALPPPPVSSGAIVFGPSGVVSVNTEPTAAGTNTEAGSAPQSAGISHPSAIGSGQSGSSPSQPAGISNSGVGASASGSSPSGSPGPNTAGQNTSKGGATLNSGESTIGASGSSATQPAGGSASDAGSSQSGNAVTSGTSEQTAPPVVPHFTKTGEPAPISYAATPGAPHTQKPIGSDSLTAIPLPTSIIHQPSVAQPTQTSEFIPVVLPTSVPPLIQPPGGMPSQPENTTRIQVGFLKALNYQFVVNSEVTQEQIFDFLPPGIAYGLGIPVENVTMETLKADETSTDLPYIRTLALAFIPKEQVNNLYLDLHTPTQRIYHNPNSSIAQLMDFIDPSVSIQAENPMTGSSGPGAGSPEPSATNPADAGAPIGGGIGNDAPVRSSSVAIGVGVVCGAAAYGAAMFFIARRYKMRRQSHGRSPSMFNSPVYSGSQHDVMAGANDALMSGARGYGGRSASPGDGYGYGYGRDSRGSGRSGSTGRQQISAPVMAENSLGWN